MRAAAYLNWGRWLARCPKCNTPNDINPEQPDFICPVCYPGMRAWAIRTDPDGLGRPIPDPAAIIAATTLATQADEIHAIDWPANRVEIEAAMQGRGTPEMNWKPGQALEKRSSDAI